MAKGIDNIAIFTDLSTINLNRATEIIDSSTSIQLHFLMRLLSNVHIY